MRLILCVAIVPLVVLGACSSDKLDCDEGSHEMDGECWPNEAADTGTGTGTGAAPFFVTTMVHMEGGHIDDVDPDAFAAHLAMLRHGMSVADEYEAKLTIESELPFATAVTESGETILTDALAGGHGVGTHCDVGYPDPPASLIQFAALLEERKTLMDNLVGPENNRGCSGAGSSADWAQALIAAGFVYVDGLVSIHYLSMPPSARPDLSWTDEWIRSSGAFHDPAPYELEVRTHPFMVADAMDFLPDQDGTLLISSGGTWALHQQAEGYSCSDCAFDTDDATAAIASIKAALAVHDPTRVGKISFHIHVGDLAAEHAEALRAFFEAVDVLVTDGRVAWATQGEVYDAFVAR